MALEGGVPNNGADEVERNMEAYFFGVADKGLQGGGPIVCGSGSWMWVIVCGGGGICSEGC